MGEHHDTQVWLVDPIGSGAGGVVWRAWHRRRHRYVAAKPAPAPVPADHADLQHPHVLRPDEVVAHAGRPFALMRLVRGGTTDRLLAEHGALPAAYVAVLLDQLLDALGAVHREGLVHRDVKPANLLLEPTGSARPHLHLADLDAAAFVGSPPTTSARTPGYVAPEVEAGAPPDPRHDLFAAGVTAAELLTGHRPRGRRDLPRGPLRVVLLALTEPDPRHRPASAADARALLEVPAGAPWRRTPHPPDVPDRLPRPGWLTRRRVQGLRAAQ